MPADPSSQGTVARASSLLAMALVACAATPPPPAVGGSTAARAPGPAEACLAAASAKRPRVDGEPARIGVRHLLVKYKGASKAATGVTRTREEACLRAREAHGKLVAGADFAELVKEYSEEAGAATRQGSLGTIERKDVVPAFGDAAFELSAPQYSDVVESDFGFHVIFRYE